MSRFLRSGARCDLVFGRSAPCVQIATQSQHRREHTTERQGTSPEVYPCSGTMVAHLVVQVAPAVVPVRKKQPCEPHVNAGFVLKWKAI